MKKITKIFLVLILVLCVAVGMAHAAVFPIRSYYNETVYMPVRVYLSWENGLEVGGNITLEGGQTKEIYIGVTDIDNDGEINQNDFNTTTISCYLQLEADDAGVADYLSDCGITPDDLANYTYDQILTLLTPEQRNKVNNMVNTFFSNVKADAIVFYSIAPQVGGTTDMLSVTSVLGNYAMDSDMRYRLPAPYLTIGRMLVTAREQAGNAGATFEPSMATLSATVRLSTSGSRFYAPTLPTSSATTTMTNIEIQHSDTKGGSCNAGLGMLALFALVPAMSFSRRN